MRLESITRPVTCFFGKAHTHVTFSPKRRIKDVNISLRGTTHGTEIGQALIEMFESMNTQLEELGTGYQPEIGEAVIQIFETINESAREIKGER